MIEPATQNVEAKAQSSHRVHVWLGIALSVVLLWLAVRNVAWQAFVDALRRVNAALLLPAVALLLLGVVFRGLRWRALLTSVTDVPLGDSLSYTLIGYLANNVLPLRAGELIRSALLGAKLRVSKSGVFATVVVERIIDVLSLMFLVAVLLVFLRLPGVITASILAVETVAVLAAVGLFLVARSGVSFDRLVPHWLPDRVRSKAVASLGGFVSGLGILTDSRQLMVAVVWSLLSWATFTGYVLLVMWAAGLTNLPWYVSLLVVVVTNAGSAIPSSPGFVGGYHFLVVYALALWSVPAAQALGFAVLCHGLSYVIVTLLGALALWRENLAFSQLQDVQEISAAV